MYENSDSQFASARRSDQQDINHQRSILAEYNGSLRQVYDAVSEIILILNENRQIVFYNSVMSSIVGCDNPESIYGMRPGEALGCLYACKNPGGCGTSAFCTQCGAVHAILSALSHKEDLKECRLLKGDSVEAIDLLVRTTPLTVKEHSFCIVAIVDISHEKRRRTLERIFFHDVMNTVASIKLLASMLTDDMESFEISDFRRNLDTGIKQLIDELLSQKELLAAENNELRAKMRTVNCRMLLKEVVDLFRSRFRDHRIECDVPAAEVVLTTDPGLLQRVLGNMIQNAVEASLPEEAISVSCRVLDNHIEFCVHNNSYIPSDIQLLIFQRSFSTKGAGRGLGTYSMKLLSERYLNGTIRFDSSEQLGTTFVARYSL
ncbi:MAG: hypothetical protein VR64_18105 [Desulfatitalea sp. BRH_c12]|nr:MAG: hypothetical protein VR64_18105 [Desulfatitalea sp. BRH_c12]